MTRLPDFVYDGPDPDGFMTAAESAGVPPTLRDLVRRPVVEHTTVAARRPRR